MSEKLETSELEAGEVNRNFKNYKKSEPKHQVKVIKKCQGDTVRECHTEYSDRSSVELTNQQELRNIDLIPSTELLAKENNEIVDIFTQE